MRLTDIPNNNSGIDAMTLANGLHVMVYTPRGLTAGSEFGPRTPLVLALSTNGRRWENVLTLEDGAGEYSYPSIIQGDDGTLHIVYTYRRTHIKYVHVGITEYD
jgi:alpha-L-rhamnosidase